MFNILHSKNIIRVGFSLLLLALVPATSGAGSLVDHVGSMTEWQAPFTRIVSLYGAHTENLFSLGLEDRIIGVGRNETFPPEALTKPKFHYRDGVEKFLQAGPDLVLIRPMISRGAAALVAKLRSAGIAVVSLQPRTIEDMFEYWSALGRLTGSGCRAKAMVTRFKTELAKYRSLTADIPVQKRTKVYLESMHSKMKTFSPTSMAVFVLEAAGGINLAADARTIRNYAIAAYGKERIMARAEEIEVFLAQIGPMNRVTPEIIRNEPGFSAIKAVREGRVHIIEEALISRPTMRLLEGIEAIGRILYPKRFKAVQ